MGQRTTWNFGSSETLLTRDDQAIPGNERTYTPFGKPLNRHEKRAEKKRKKKLFGK